MALWMAERGLHCLSLKQSMVARLGARNAVRGVLSLWSWGVQGRVLLDTTIWVPNGLSQVGLARVRPDSEFYRNPFMTLGGYWCVPTGSPNLLVLSALGLAHLPIGFFFKEPYGEIGPLSGYSPGLFLFSLMIYLNYYLRGLGFLALILSPAFKVCPKRKKVASQPIG